MKLLLGSFSNETGLVKPVIFLQLESGKTLSSEELEANETSILRLFQIINDSFASLGIFCSPLTGVRRETAVSFQEIQFLAKYPFYSLHLPP